MLIVFRSSRGSAYKKKKIPYLYLWLRMLPYIPMTDHIADGAFGQCPFRSTNPNHYVNPNPKPLTPQTLTLSNHPDTLIIEALSMSLILKRRWGLVVTGGLRQGLRRSSNLGGSYSTAGGNDVNGGNGGTHSGRGNISVEKALDLSMSGTFSPRGSVSGMVVSRGSVSVLVGSRGSVSGVVSRCYAGKNDSGGGEDGGVGGSASFSEEKLGMTQQGKKGVAVTSPGGKVSRLVRLESELNAELDAEPGLKDPKDIWKRMGMKIEGAEGGKGDGAAKIIDETPRRKGSVAERQTQEKPLESSRVKGIKTVLGFSNEYPPIELAPEDYDFTDFTDLTTRPPRMPIETDSKVSFILLQTEIYFYNPSVNDGDSCACFAVCVTLVWMFNVYLGCKM